MPRLACPNCEKKLVVPDSMAGKAGLCPKCKYRVDIPPLKSKSRDDDDEVSDSFEDDEGPPRWRRRDEDERSDRRITARRGGRSRRDEDEDEEDRPSRRRSRDEDEEDDRPPRPRRRRRREGSGGGISSGMITLGVMGGILLVVCIVALAVPAVAVVPVGLGYLLAIVGGIWFLVVAFRDDVIQGLLCWLVPFYSLYYLITHFDEEKYPFLTQVAGMVLIVVGACAGGAGVGMSGK